MILNIMGGLQGFLVMETPRQSINVKNVEYTFIKKMVKRFYVSRMDITTMLTVERRNKMELKDTIKMMDNADYKERFKAEYYQLKIRLDKLVAMVDKWDKGELEFVPTCPRCTYALQTKFMYEYMAVLEMRAKIEGIDLD